MSMSNQTPDEFKTESIVVEIFNQTYSLRSSNGAEHVKQIAQFVDERMRQIASQITTHDIVKIAVLAALNITDEMQNLRGAYESEIQALVSQSTESPAPIVQPAESEIVQPMETEEASRQEGNSGQSWFDSIFDSEVPTKSSSERLSSQISAKLQSRRPSSSAGLTIKSEEKD